MNQSVPLRLVRTGLVHILSDVLFPASQTAVAGTLAQVWLGLFTSWPGFSIDLDISQLTEATYGGYARQPVIWGFTGIDGQNRPQVMGDSSEYRPNSSVVQETIIGAFIADAMNGGKLVGAGLLSQGVVMSTPVSVLTIMPRFAVPGISAPDWGEIVAVH